MGYVNGESRDQSSLFPLSLDDLVPVDHPVRVIDAFVGRLDLAELGFLRARPAGTGRPAYDPADLLRIFLYGYTNRLRSSRRLEQECRRNVELMWLVHRLAPDHKTLAEFRRLNGDALRRTAAAFVQFCRRVGLVRGEWIAIDGSKFQAAGSARSIVDRAELEAEREAIEARIGAWLEALEQADAGDVESSMDPEVVRAALAELETDRATVDGQLADIAASDRRRWVETEPEARVLKGVGPGYNVQTAVDAEHHLIVSQAVIDEAGDNRALQPMTEQVCAALSSTEFHVVADTGYSNGAQAAALQALGVEVHVPSNRARNPHGGGTLFDRSAFEYDPDSDTLRCPAGRTLKRKQLHKRDQSILYRADTRDCSGCSLKARCTEGKVRYVTRHLYDEALVRMNDRATPAAMRLRRSTVEHPFATLKYEIFEKPRFLLRGLWGAGTELALATLSYNLKRAISVMGAGSLARKLSAG